MADLNEGYKSAKSKIKGFKTFKDIKTGISDITEKNGDSDSPANFAIANPLNKLEEQKNRAQKEIQSQLNQIIDLIKANKGNGPNTAENLKNYMIKIIKKFRPEVEQIVEEEIIKLLGCSQQQTYEGDQVIYIRVATTDFRGQLLIDPQSNVGKISYEKNKDLDYAGLKYPMNRQLYERIQNEGVEYTFKGASGRELFDISFVQQDGNGAPGNFFKVRVKDRIGTPNKVADFIRDYYKRMAIVELKKVIGEIINSLTGAISLQSNVGINQKEDNSKFSRILARILGLCFDNKGEIDVSGSSKIGELDNLDDDFFEFTDLDLMKIYQEIANIQSSAVELEGCDNIKFPVNSFEIVDSLDELNFIDEEDDEAIRNALDKARDTFLSNPNGLGLQVGMNFSLNFDFSVIANFPQSFISSIISPKIFLGILIMFKAMGKFTPNLEVNSMMEFTQKYRRFFIGLASRIGALFVRELFRLLKQEIIQLLKSIAKDLVKEDILKKYTAILTLVGSLIKIVQLVRDWRQCKSVLDQLLSLLKIPSLGLSNQKVPIPLLFLAPTLDGYSVERGYINYINELQAIGYPTGPLPDGRTNISLIKDYCLMKGQGKELWENAKTELVIPPLAHPFGPTSPISWSGKFI
jgi:hypothetical protein